MKALLHSTAILVTMAGPARGQVGHDPATSPYRDLRYGQFVTLTVGQLFGQGGKLGIGPHSGQMAILRHDFLADRPLSIALGAGLARVDRKIADLGPVPRRLIGPIQHNVYFAEGTAQFNLAGGKTWHNAAPYVSLGLGLAMAETIPNDSSRYRFGTKFYLAPAVGVRYFLTRRLFLKVEARTTFWSLSYPVTFRDDPDGPFGPAGPLLTGEIKEWSPTPLLHAGFGFAFHRPFF